ncbi:MAG: peptidoglycan DD-metalloendopeptidase family protein [Synergistaceae bacterium]|jgi:hypothetical protein|nr:peptidoglycan DD-metalloendopeptidase family protein [Synergistaceae bacterium]
MPSASHKTTNNDPGYDFGSHGVSIPVYTPYPIAKVNRVEYSASGYGNFVDITLQDNWRIIIAHLASPSTLVVGQTNLGADTLIGYSGATGLATGIHIHFEIYMDRNNVNSLHLFGLDNASWGVGTTVPVKSSAPDSPTPPEYPGNPGGNDPGIIRPANLVTFSAVTAGIAGDKWHVDKGLCEAPRVIDMEFPNDDLSSLYINEDNVVIELFEHENFQGKSIRLDHKGFYDLRNYDFDDITSSYKVTDPTMAQPVEHASYTVMSVSIINGNLVMDIVNDATGEHISPYCVRNDNYSFLVKLPSGTTTYHINSPVRIHTDSAFTTGGRVIGNNGQSVEFSQGDTVVFSPHDATWSATIWVEGDGGGQDDTPVKPTDPGTPSGLDSPDGNNTHTVDVNFNGLEGVGGGCNSESSKGLLGIALTYIAAGANRKRRG